MKLVSIADNNRGLCLIWEEDCHCYLKGNSMHLGTSPLASTYLHCGLRLIWVLGKRVATATNGKQ